MLKKTLSLVHSKAKLVYLTRQSWKGREKSGVLNSIQKPILFPVTEKSISKPNVGGYSAFKHPPPQFGPTCSTASTDSLTSYLDVCVWSLTKKSFTTRRTMNTVPFIFIYGGKVHDGTTDYLKTTPNIIQQWVMMIASTIQCAAEATLCDPVGVESEVFQESDPVSHIEDVENVDDTPVFKAYRNDDPFQLPLQPPVIEEPLIDQEPLLKENKTKADYGENVCHLPGDLSCDTFVLKSSLTDVRNSEHVHINTASCLLVRKKDSSTLRRIIHGIQELKDENQAQQQMISLFIYFSLAFQIVSNLFLLLIFLYFIM